MFRLCVDEQLTKPTWQTALGSEATFKGTM